MSIKAIKSQTQPNHTSIRLLKKTQTAQLRLERLRSYFDDLKPTLGIHNSEDWYNVNWNEGNLKTVRDSIIRWYFGGSPAKALMTLYPEYAFLPWNFKHSKIPSGYWEQLSNQKQFLTWFAKQHNIDKPEDWYQVLNTDIIHHGGRGLLTIYDQSLCKALNSVFSDTFEWKEWGFTKSPTHFWNSMENQRQFMDYAATQLNIKQPSDWYFIKAKQIKMLGGWGLLDNQYGGSLPRLLAAVYPDIQWKPWLFDPAPKGLWSSEDTIRQYLQWIADQCGIVHISDWNYISRVQLKDAKALLDKTGGLHGLLRRFFPGYDTFKPKKVISKSQHRLYTVLKQIFDPLDVIMDYTHPKLVHTTVNKHLQFDIYISALHMAFEYQGEHHYQFHYLYGDPQIQQARDAEKRLLCEQVTYGLSQFDIQEWYQTDKYSILVG